MKGAVFESQGAQPKVVDNLEKPKPGPGQLLVKSLWTAINPVDGFMANYGLLVVEWPLVLAVDASGVVVEVGDGGHGKHGFKVGDYVCGCTRLGSKQYSAGQEFFLMDSAVTIPKPKNLSLVEAATIGVASETACLGLFDGLKLDLPSTNSATEKNEWVVVMGGASSVGKAAVQLARAAGYRVLASCSSKSAGLVKELGASTFDYKKSTEDQVKAILDTTDDKLVGCFDAAAAGDPVVIKELYKHTASSGQKPFSTTNDWSGITDFEGGSTHLVQLGGVGRPNAETLNKKIEEYIPTIVHLVEAGKLKASEYEEVGSGGFDALVEAYAYQAKGTAGSRKVVVKIQDE